MAITMPPAAIAAGSAPPAPAGAGLARHIVDPRIWLLSMGAFAVGIDAFVMAGILPRIGQDLGVSLGAAGQVVSAYALSYAIGAPVLGALTGQAPRERLAIYALLGFLLANAGCALAPTYPALLAARIAAGLAASVFTPTAYGLAAVIAPVSHRGAALAAVALGLTTSTLVGVPLGVWMSHAFGWRATFWLVTALSAGAIAALALSSLPRLAPPAAHSLRERLAPLGRRPVLLALWPQLLWNIAGFTVYTYFAALVGAGGYPPSIVPGLLLVYGFGSLVGSQLGGRLADRFGPGRPIAGFLVLAAVNQALLPLLLSHPALTIASLFVWSFASWGLWAPQQTGLFALDPEGSNVIIALANSTVYMSSAIGAGLGAAMLPFVSPVSLPLVGSAFYAAALTAFVSSPCRRRSIMAGV